MKQIAAVPSAESLVRFHKTNRQESLRFSLAIPGVEELIYTVQGNGRRAYLRAVYAGANTWDIAVWEHPWSVVEADRSAGLLDRVRRWCGFASIPVPPLHRPVFQMLALRPVRLAAGEVTGVEAHAETLRMFRNLALDSGYEGRRLLGVPNVIPNEVRQVL